MSRRNWAGFIRPGYNPLRVANAPTIGTATDSKTDGSVSVAFTAPSCVGGGAITGYTAVANCGSKFGSGSSSPITVTGLTNCTAYTFKVYANNAFGPSAYSASSNSVTPTKIPTGQQAYTTSGTYSWVAPTGVTSVSVVAVGSGGGGGTQSKTFANYGGGGGGLTYANNYSVTAGNSYTVVVGAASSTNGNFSSFVCVKACGGKRGRACGTQCGLGGGGSGGTASFTGGQGGATGGGGGGAAGYTANGSNGKAAGGGQLGAGGGGVGLLGGAAGGGGGGVGTIGVAGSATGGAGGSGGCAGGTNPACWGGPGGNYGGGGGSVNCLNGSGVFGGGGAVRIIWPGNTRQFPSTCTGDK